MENDGESLWSRNLHQGVIPILFKHFHMRIVLVHSGYSGYQDYSLKKIKQETCNFLGLS